MAATNRPRRLLWPTVAAAIVFAILLGLGFWQVERLRAKQALLGDMRAGFAAPPALLRAGGEPARYARMRAEGRFISASPGFVFTIRDGRPGYLVIRPFRLADGRMALVDTGFVPREERAPAAGAPASGESVAIAGFTVPGETRGLFTPQADWPRRIFYIRDIAGLARVLGLVEAEPYLIELTEPAATVRTHLLRAPARVLAAIPNRHLGYALTWFGLALCLVGVYIAFAVKTLRTDRETA